MDIESILCVIPSIVGLGELFSIKIKLKGSIHKIKSVGDAFSKKPALVGPFNLNEGRGLQYHDDCLEEWQGTIVIGNCDALEGERKLVFDGLDQGVFLNDTRPIKIFEGYKWNKPGFHFIKLMDEASGSIYFSNPVYVTENKPVFRIYWGDPHWQTFFSDGLRCPEELYAFARDETFLDFGAISDHMEAITDRQWEYFISVSNDFNSPGRFATLIGQEWTNHRYGHRNIYYRGDAGPALRSDDPNYNTLEKLWKALEGIGALLIPHHPANAIMGCDWSLGWNPELEKAVEIYSCWGSSEMPGDKGNTRPLKHCNGEVKGRHVVDALNAGYKFSFVGGGDIHDGRPGDYMDYRLRGDELGTYAQGITAVYALELTRESVFDAMYEGRSYATTNSRIFLTAEINSKDSSFELDLKTASEDGILKACVVINGKDEKELYPADDVRIIECKIPLELSRADYCYIRVLTQKGDMAWSSPVWGA